MDDEAGEDELALRQDPRLYPLGRLLRTTFNADNHASLGSDVAGLMLDLSRVPAPGERPGAAASMRAPPPAPGSPAQVQPPARPSRLGWVGELFARR